MPFYFDYLTFQQTIQAAFPALIRVLITLTGALIGSKISEVLIKKVFKAMALASPTQRFNARVKTLASTVSNAVSFVIFILAALSILSSVGVDIAPILTGAGVLGLAISFGSQSLVKDVVSGFFIVLENQYDVGDKVEIAGSTGKVLKVGIKTTVIKDKRGNLYFIPNSSIVKVKRIKPKEDKIDKKSLKV